MEGRKESGGKDLPVRAGGDELGDSVGEGGEGVDVEDGEGVLAVGDAAVGEDDGDEVDAGGAEEGERRGARQVLDVDGGDVADDVLFVVGDGERRDAFGVEELERGGQRLVAAAVKNNELAEAPRSGPRRAPGGSSQKEYG